MKKTIILFGIFLILSLCAYGQKTKIEFDTRVVEGQWVAVDDGISYELTLTKEMVSYAGIDFEMLIASMKYTKDGKVIREIKADGINSCLSGGMYDANSANFLFFDEDRKMAGKARLELNITNKKLGVWTLGLYREYTGLSTNRDWNKSTFDIPSRLEFKKKEIPLAERPLIVPEEEFTPIKAE